MPQEAVLTMIIQAAIVVGVVFSCFAGLTVIERKLIGRFQARVGPNRAGPFGLLQPLDQIVMVAVTSAHRGESFAACEFLMDYLKTQAPFWKKEHTPEGARWVDARVTDDAALARWGIAASNAGV